MDPVDNNQYDKPETNQLDTPPAMILPQDTTVPVSPQPVQPTITPNITPLPMTGNKKKIWPFIVVLIVLLAITAIVAIFYVAQNAILSIRDGTNVSLNLSTFTPIADSVSSVDYLGYTPNSDVTQQMEGNGMISSDTQTVSFKISSDWVFDKDFSDANYNGDPFFLMSIESGKTIRLGTYTMPLAYSEGDVLLDARWHSLDEVIAVYIKNAEKSPDSQSAFTIDDKTWAVIIQNNVTGGKNINITAMISIDNNDNFDDLAYVVELMTPTSLSEEEFTTAVKEVKFMLSTIVSDAK